MKIKIPKIEYVEMEVYSKKYEETIGIIRNLKSLGIEVKYSETFTETGWEIIISTDLKEQGYIYKGEWEETYAYHVETMPLWSDRIDVEVIVDKLHELIKQFGQLTILDLYETVKAFEPTFEFVEEYLQNRYGWTETSKISVIRLRGGYTIKVGGTKELD